MNDPWLLLGVSRDAGDETIRRAWLDAVRRHPPERDPARFQAIRAAFERIDTRRNRLAHALFATEPPDLDTLLGLALRHARGSDEGTARPSPDELRRLIEEGERTVSGRPENGR